VIIHLHLALQEYDYNEQYIHELITWTARHLC
jgi:hypothetical protein